MNRAAAVVFITAILTASAVLGALYLPQGPESKSTATESKSQITWEQTSTSSTATETRLSKTSEASATSSASTTTVQSQTATRTYKPLSPTTIMMLIGDLEYPLGFYRKMDLALSTGVDTVEIVFRTTSVEDGFGLLDNFVEYAANRGLGVVLRVVVDSTKFTERILGDPSLPDNNLPDYTNSTQFAMGKKLLTEVILHLEQFPNVVGYQVEWGHYGESWINAQYWNTRSANQSFANFISKVAPNLPVNQTGWWWNDRNIEGDIVYYSPNLPNNDPRTDAAKVALFYWYQEWRNQATYNITVGFRCLAKELTSKPILGFSYVGTATVPYVYTANKCVDIALSPFAPSPYYTPTKFYIRDAYFNGMQFAELDFNTPYILFSYARIAIKDMYEKGIVPIIFYPAQETQLNESEISMLVKYMRTYSCLYSKAVPGQVLVVTGNDDIGVGVPSLKYTAAPPIAVANWNTKDSGFISLLESKNISYDMVDATVYFASLGDRYKAVAFFTPMDTPDGRLSREIAMTKATVLLMFPTFIVSPPTFSNPYSVRSGFHGSTNEISVSDRSIGVSVVGGWGQGFTVTFSGQLSSLGTLGNYTPNWPISFYQGSFDDVLAYWLDGGQPLIARVSNFYLIGLDVTEQSRVAAEAVAMVLSFAGVSLDMVQECLCLCLCICVYPDPYPSISVAGGCLFDPDKRLLCYRLLACLLPFR